MARNLHIPTNESIHTRIGGFYINELIKIGHREMEHKAKVEVEKEKIRRNLNDRGYDVNALINAFNFYNGTPKGWPINYRLTVARDFHSQYLSCDDCQADNCCGGVCVYCEYCGADRDHYVDDRCD